MKSFIELITILWLCLMGLLLCSCVNSYEVDGSDLDWQTKPIQTLPANRVTPLLDVPLPDEIGGGTVTVPISIQK